jgi:beta-lactamase regulating signal transducer with metallopeptidase domain
MTETELLGFAGSMAFKGTVILGLAALITIVWRSASAAGRHLVWTLAVTASLALPLVAAAIYRVNAPRIEIDVWPAPESTEPLVVPFYAGSRSAETGRSVASSTAEEIRPVSIAETSGLAVAAQTETTESALALIARNDWRRNLLWLWITGMLLSLLPLVTAVIRVRLLARKARLVTSGRWHDLLAGTPAISHLACRIRILESDDTAMPMTWGITDPTLLIPSHSESWPDWRCRDILLHELAHVERRDCMTQLVAHIACAVYWFNPLAWLAAHRMRVERELACDDRVISAGARASDYAANLLEVARSLRAPSFTSQTAIAMARPSQLSGRLLAVLDAGRNRRSVTHRLAAATSATALAVLLLLASLTTAAAAAVGKASSESISPAIAAPASSEAPAAGYSALTSVAPAVIRASQLPETAVILPSASETLAPLREATGLPVAQNPACWAKSDEHSNVAISNDDESGRVPSWSVRYSSGDCSMELRAEGKFTFRADLTDLESLASNGWFRVEEREGRSTRRIEIRPGNNGTLEHQYWINGDRAAYDAVARAWLASTLLAVERRTAFAASTRVPQLYRTGGLSAVLSEISLMPGAYPKSRYFGTVLDMGIALDANTLNNIVGRASTELASSDYYMAEVLGKLASQGAANETTWRTFAEAAGRMESDYYKSQTLTRILTKARLSSGTVAILLRSASGMKSDYYLAELLKSVASKYALDASTRPYYVEALRNIESDYYRSELLRAMGSGGEWDAKTSAFVLNSVGDIKSDYYKSESLVSLVRAKHVESWPEYFDATASIGSDYYKKEALTAALRQSPLTRDVVAGVLGVAAKMRSDSEMAEVLSAAARSYTIDDGLRPAYEKAVDSMKSDYYRGSALSALRRSMAR